MVKLLCIIAPEKRWGMKETKRIVLISMLSTAIIVFIFFNSALDQVSSNEISRRVSIALNPILNPFQLIPVRVFRKFIRKLAHFLEFAVLGGLLGFGTQKVSFRGKWVVASVLAVGIACFDEIIQSFSANRNNSMLDIGIDLAGAVFGLLIVAWLTKNWNKIRRKHHG